MKTHRLIKTGLHAIVATAVAVAFTCTSLGAETKTGKGGAGDLMSKPLRTAEDIRALQPGDTVAMACPKCKTIEYTRVTREWKGNVTEARPATRHLCPGCENVFGVTGHGKAKKDVVVHKCSKCGSKNAFCCVVKGTAPTKGMDETK